MANKPPPSGRGKSYAALVALIGVSAAGMSWDLQHKWEGTKLKPYRDPIGIITECSGVTGRQIDVKHVNTVAECNDKDSRALLVHAQAVVRCTPALQHRPYLVAASIDFTYNLGGPTYCGSTVARRFNAGDYRGGCQFMIHYKFAGGKVLRGLELRRKDEIENYCLKGIS